MSRFKRFRASHEEQRSDLEISGRKSLISTHEERSNLFDRLPDDIVISILCKVSSTSGCPSDFISVLMTCKRLNMLGLHPVVLSGACAKTFNVRVRNWNDYCNRFFKLCGDAGNLDALYTLGMIRFYCFKNRRSGASLMAKAAIKNHAPALYSLAVIQFNGSGGEKNDKDLRAGVALCARAALLGYIHALRELGHCLQDGYGTRQDVAAGRRLLIQANAREIASAIRAVPRLTALSKEAQIFLKKISEPSGSFCPVVPDREVHPANLFLMEWFDSKEYGPGQALRLCSHDGCGRPETRRNEYRRCSACNNVNYCSRGCQSQDWKIRHKVECMPMDGPWILENNDDDDDDDDDGYDEEEEEDEDGDLMAEIQEEAPLAAY